jgi:hypothetical protein
MKKADLPYNISYKPSNQFIDRQISKQADKQADRYDMGSPGILCFMQ